MKRGLFAGMYWLTDFVSCSSWFMDNRQPIWGTTEQMDGNLTPLSVLFSFRLPLYISIFFSYYADDHLRSLHWLPLFLHVEFMLPPLTLQALPSTIPTHISAFICHSAPYLLPLLTLLLNPVETTPYILFLSLFKTHFKAGFFHVLPYNTLISWVWSQALYGSILVFFMHFYCLLYTYNAVYIIIMGYSFLWGCE